MGFNVIFRLYGHRSDRDRRYTGNFGNALQYIMFFGVGIPRENKPNRSWISSRSSNSMRETAFATRFAFNVWTVPDIQTSWKPSLSNLQSLYLPHGPSLSMDEQLCWSSQFETLYSLSYIHVELISLCTVLIWMELLLLRWWRLHVSSYYHPSCPSNDNIGNRSIFIHKQYAHECLLWYHDRNRNHWSTKKESNKHYESIWRGTNPTHWCTLASMTFSRVCWHSFFLNYWSFAIFSPGIRYWPNLYMASPSWSYFWRLRSSHGLHDAATSWPWETILWS